MEKMIPIIIPAYEPDMRLLELLKDMKSNKCGPVILVNAGSGKEYNNFDKAQMILKDTGGVLLIHEKNKGKGRALKTAFAYVLRQYPQAIGVVTADSDGQHTVSCINDVRSTLEQQPDNLILGVRKFDGEGIPWKSRFPKIRPGALYGTPARRAACRFKTPCCLPVRWQTMECPLSCMFIPMGNTA